MQAVTYVIEATCSLVPGPPCPAFVACSTKSRGGRPGRTYHVMCAAADVTWARLSFVSPRIHVAAITRALSMLAFTAEKATWCVRGFFCLVKSSYEKLSWTWVCQRHTSHDKSFQAFPWFFVLQATKVGMEAWERVYILKVISTLLSMVI